jgi:hypothetical protein
MSKGHRSKFEGLPTTNIWPNLSIKINNDKNELLLNKISIQSWAPMAHAYTSSYSGGREQEDYGLRLN